MIVLADSHSDEAAWLAVRKNYLTSSDLAAVMNMSKWKTPGEVHNDKLFGSDFKGNRKTWWGQFDEATVFRLLRDELRVPCARDGKLYQVGASRLAATLDGASTDESMAQRIVDLGNVTADVPGATKALDRLLYLSKHKVKFVVEAKVTEIFSAKEWATPPRYYWCQVQAAMAAAEARAGLLIGRIGAHDCRLHVIERDQKFIDNATKVANDFMKGVDHARAVVAGM